MTATGVDRFQDLLSTRAAKGPALGIHGAQPLTYQFGSGKPDPGSFPYQDLVRAMADVMEVEGADALTYGTPAGYEGLRDWVAHKYRLFEGLEVGRNNILVTNGSGDALGQVIQAFVDEGDAVICEAPTFLGTLRTLRRNGADLYGAEVDAEGMRLDQVEAHLERLAREGRRCKLIYTIDYFQNPAGPTLSEARRRGLLELARKHNVMILEDDAYGELRFEGVAPPSLYALDDSGLVCRSGTLSKTLGAGVRIGWVLAPEPLVPYLAAFNPGGGVSPLTSRICTYYMRDQLETHVPELCGIYKAKRDAMLAELERGLGDTDAAWSRPEGGFFIWLKLPSGTDTKELARLAGERSVGFVGGAAFMPNGGGDDYIRLAYSFEAPAEIGAGTRLLCEAIKGAQGEATR